MDAREFIMTLSLHKSDHGRGPGRRIYAEIPVGIAICSRRFSFSHRRPQVHGTVRHPSMAGLELITESAIPVGAVVRLWIRISDGADAKPLKLRGDVVWAKAGDAGESYRAGVHLRDRPRTEMETWTNFITERIRRNDL